jgi:hypothetical protein
MVRRILLVFLALASTGGCEIVVDDGTRVLVPMDAAADTDGEPGADGADPPAEASLSDAAAMDPEAGSDCSTGCLGQASSCHQTCNGTAATCSAGCQGAHSGPCQAQCAQEGTSCNGGCTTQCMACLTQTACAETHACSQ